MEQMAANGFYRETKIGEQMPAITAFKGPIKKKREKKKEISMRDVYVSRM